MSQVSIIDIEGNHPQIPTQFDANVGFAIPIGNVLEILGEVVAAGAIPVQTVGSGNTITTQVQRTQAISVSDADAVGLAAFDSEDFTVDSNGFVSLSGTVGGTITGNSGGPIAPVAGNWDIITANSTVKVVGTVGTLTLDFGLNNLLLGDDGATITSGSENVGVGFNCLNNITSGGGNTGVGFNALENLETGTNNTVIGLNSAFTLVSGSNNVALGVGALFLANGVSSNLAIGYTALNSLLTGNTNIGIGVAAGTNYAGAESSNICIGNQGVLGESNTLRIGTNGAGGGQQSRAFMAGITGVIVSASAPVAIDSNSQLSSLGFGTSGQILTSNGAGVSPSWQASTPDGIITINGDTGSVTGNPVTFTGVNSGSTVKFSGSGSTMDFNVADASGNILMGDFAGNGTLSGSQNNGFGESVGSSLTSGSQNSFLGAVSGGSVTSGSGNTFIGFAAGGSLTQGGNNTFLGVQAGNNLLTGNQNLLLGRQAGTNYTTNESGNILLANDGVLGESNIIRIGTVGTHTVTYLPGQIRGENGTGGAPTYSFISAVDCGMSTDGTNTYISGAGFATGSFGFNVTLSGGINSITQGFILSGIDTKTAGFTTAYNKYLYLVDVTTGSASITAQLISSPITGQIYEFKDSTGAAATYNIVISGTDSGKTIDGSNTYSITSNYGAVKMIYNGTQWNVL